MYPPFSHHIFLVLYRSFPGAKRKRFKGKDSPGYRIKLIKGHKQQIEDTSEHLYLRIKNFATCWPQLVFSHPFLFQSTLQGFYLKKSFMAA